MSRRTCVRNSPSTQHHAIRHATVLEGLELRRLLSDSSLEFSRADEVDGIDFGGAVAVQPWDDMIVALVNTDSGAKLARYTPAGAPAGTIDLGPGLGTAQIGLAVNLAVSANKLVVVGDDSVNSGDIRVAQFDSAGALDWSVNFDVGATLGDPATMDTASSVAIRPGGTIVVSGTGGDHMFVAEVSGSALVPGFGTNGIAQITFPYVSQNNGMTLDGNGMAVLVGSVTNTGNNSQDFAVARVTTDGTLDGIFNESAPFADDGGTLVIDNATNIESFNAVVTSNGDIFAVGVNGGVGVLARVSGAGAFDTSFGGDGLVEVVGAATGAVNVALDGFGNLLIVGSAGNGQFSLSRYTSAGVADTSFDESAPSANDGDGNVQTPIGGFAISSGIAVDEDGLIVLAGTSFDSFPFFATADLALARYGDNAAPNTPPTNLAITRGDDAVRTLDVAFTGSFTDPGDTDQVRWDFGDGNVIAFHPSTDAGALTPTHAFATTGTYLVTFSVKDGGGNEVSATHQVVVKEAGIIAGQLYVVGAAGNDVITVKDNVNGVFKVRFGNSVVGQFNQSQLSKIIINGGNGADDITIEADVTLPSEIYGGDGDDVIKGGGGDDVMFGEGGNDKLKARNANDILVGGAGSDTLAGGDGRDLLFGGAGADKIAGQDDSDIILSGTSSYDTPASLAALQAIHTEWCRTDLNTSQRINSIKAGVGPGNAYKLLGGTTVFDDGARDTLTSGSGGDWFLANPGGTSVLDKITDLNSVDFLDSITFILAP